MTVRIDVTAPDDPRGGSVVANARLVGVDGLTLPGHGCITSTER